MKSVLRMVENIGDDRKIEITQLRIFNDLKISSFPHPMILPQNNSLLMSNITDKIAFYLKFL
jgi:hypothetical protein